jgi:hypothetical protein
LAHGDLRAKQPACRNGRTPPTVPVARLTDPEASASSDSMSISKATARPSSPNAIRGHMAELGIISAKGRNGTAELLEIIANAVALANKIARMAWAMMVRRERFKEPKLLPAA